MKKTAFIILFMMVCSSTMASTTHEIFGPVTRYQLDNGLTVLLKPIDHAHSVSAQVWFRAGSLYEDETNNGLSHFLEHMLFKGTEKYSATEINQLVENVGGKQNAATSKDFTFYYVTLPSSHWKRSLEVLEQMTFHSTLPEDEFNKEREVVLSELARYQDNPRRLLWLKFIPQLYEDHPYEQLTIGSREVLQDVTHDQLRNFYNQYYQPSRATLVVAGDFDTEPVKNTITSLYSNNQSGESFETEFPEVHSPDSDSVTVEEKNIEQVYGILGTTGVNIDSGQSIAMDILVKIFGSGKSSRLYEKLVVDRELASSISASYWTQQETGPVMVRFQTEKNKLEELRSAIRDQIETIARDGVTQEELERARTQMSSDFIYKTQTPKGQARQLGYWESIADLDYLEDYLDRIQQTTQEDVNELAQTILQEQNWRGTIFVPSD